MVYALANSAPQNLPLFAKQAGSENGSATKLAENEERTIKAGSTILQSTSENVNPLTNASLAAWKARHSIALGSISNLDIPQKKLQPLCCRPGLWKTDRKLWKTCGKRVRNCGKQGITISSLETLKKFQIRA